MIPWWLWLLLASIAAGVLLWPPPERFDHPDFYDRRREDEDYDPERDRDPEVERRWFGVEPWGGDDNG